MSHVFTILPSISNNSLNQLDILINLTKTKKNPLQQLPKSTLYFSQLLI